MWVSRRLQLLSRSLYSQCCHFGSAEDPGFFGLYGSQDQEKRPPQQQAESVHDDAHTQRERLCMAFRSKIREWARTTPPEYISRTPSRLRPQRKKSAETIARKKVERTDDHDHGDDKEEDDDVDDDELDVVDDEDALNALDQEDDDYNDKEDGTAYHGCKHDPGFHDKDVDIEGADDLQRKSGDGRHRLEKDTVDNKARRKMLPCDPQNDGSGDADEQLYYYTEKGKLKYKPILIMAPKDEIYQRLSQSGLVSSRLKRPLPVLKLVKRTDAEIVGWYYYCSIELLQFFRICHNLKEVKAIVEYHVRWSAIRTLAKKYRCNPREIVKKYGRDLECEDKKGKKVRLMTRQEIKEVTRGVNKRVEMYHRFLALNILDEMD